MEVVRFPFARAKKILQGFFTEGSGPFKTWTRLADMLGVSREALSTMEKVLPKDWTEEQRAAFLLLLRRTRARIEADEHDRLYDKELHKAALLSLKNNHGWVEKQEMAAELSGGLEVTLAGELETYAG